MSIYKKITYSEAINQGMHQAMELSKDVMVMGQLIDYKPGVFGTTVGLVEKFGEKRVRDFPVAESLMTSAGIGAAVAGQRVVLVHIRIDFMMYALDAMVNWLSLWRFKSNKESNVPLVIRAMCVFSVTIFSVAIRDAGRWRRGYRDRSESRIHRPAARRPESPARKAR